MNLDIMKQNLDQRTPSVLRMVELKNQLNRLDVFLNEQLNKGVPLQSLEKEISEYQKINNEYIAEGRKVRQIRQKLQNDVARNAFHTA